MTQWKTALASLSTVLPGCALAAAAGFLLFPAQQTPARHPHFTDIAPRSRFSYVANNDFTGRKYFSQPMCGGVGILDYDRNGRMDVFSLTASRNPGCMSRDRSV